MHENHAQGQNMSAAGYAVLGNHAPNAQALMQKQAAYAQETCAQDVRTSDMQSIGQRLGGLLNSLVLHNERLQTISDRLTGSEIAKDGSQAQPPRPVPNGHIALFNMALDEICARLERADQIVNRINNAV